MSLSYVYIMLITKYGEFILILLFFGRITYIYLNYFQFTKDAQNKMEYLFWGLRTREGLKKIWNFPDLVDEWVWKTRFPKEICFQNAFWAILSHFSKKYFRGEGLGYISYKCHTFLESPGQGISTQHHMGLICVVILNPYTWTFNH